VTRSQLLKALYRAVEDGQTSIPGYVIKTGWGCDCPGGNDAIYVVLAVCPSGRDIAHYAWLERTRPQTRGDWERNQARENSRVDELTKTCERGGITYVSEFYTKPGDAYRRREEMNEGISNVLNFARCDYISARYDIYSAEFDQACRLHGVEGMVRVTYQMPGKKEVEG